MDYTETKEGLTKKIFKIAIPSIIGFLGLTFFETVDIFWIGKLNSKAVAACAAASFMEWMLYALMNLSNTGCATIVSQFIGAKKNNEKFEVIKEATQLCLIFSIIIIAILYFIIDDIFWAMGLDSTTHHYAISYFRILLIGFPGLYLLNLLGNIFNAHGDTKTSTIILLSILLINLVLDPLLIFGYYGFPKMGIQGAATATVISVVLGLIVRFYILRRKNYIPPLKSFFTLSFNYFKRLIKIGFPTTTTHFAWSMVYPLLTRIITVFGMAPLAALNICHRIEGIPYFFSVGFSIALSTLIGQYYGKGNIREVKKIFKRGVVLITLLMTPVSLAFIFIPETLISLINQDPELIAHGKVYLRIIGYLELFLGWEVAIEGAFNGLGNTKAYMFLCVPLTLSRVPLAWLFGIYLKMGTIGIWWAISITTGIKGVLMLVTFLTNKTNRKIFASMEKCV